MLLERRARLQGRRRRPSWRRRRRSPPRRTRDASPTGARSAARADGVAGIGDRVGPRANGSVHQPASRPATTASPSAPPPSAPTRRSITKSMAARSPASHKLARVVAAERADGEIAPCGQKSSSWVAPLFADIRRNLPRRDRLNRAPVEFSVRSWSARPYAGRRARLAFRRANSGVKAKVALFQDADRHGHDRRLAPGARPAAVSTVTSCAIPTDMRRRRFETDRHVRAELGRRARRSPRAPRSRPRPKAGRNPGSRRAPAPRRAPCG